MQLKRMRVENFRALEDVTVAFDGYYTAISGQNNAGKTSLLRAIRHMCRDQSRDSFGFRPRNEVTHGADRTQWGTNKERSIVFEYEFDVSRVDDPGLLTFLEKFADRKLEGQVARCRVKVSFGHDAKTTCEAWVDEVALSSYAANELLQKLRSSTLAFGHDSAHSYYPFFGTPLHELLFTAEELQQVSDELAKVQARLTRISKSHKAELTDLLGRLNDKFEVEFSIPDGMFSGPIPFAVNLKDKNVDVPLNDWGSGTKNRTQIMISMLYASRIRTNPDENTIAPFVLIEEPESFLHPAAQAEFGRVLVELANTLKVQTIVTTHSPYMLCQRNHASNVLLQRKVSRRKTLQTEVVTVDEANWMAPFAEILGLDNAEFAPWKEIVLSKASCVVLVEGELDREYLEHISGLGYAGLTLPDGVDIVPYGGKDAINNVILLKFVIERFKKVLVTFDLDAKKPLEATMSRVGLKEGEGYLCIGINKPGQQCIEGLLPARTMKKVHAEHTDLVMCLTGEQKDRKSAKSSLKKLLLEEMKGDASVTRDDLKPFLSVFRAIAQAASSS